MGKEPFVLSLSEAFAGSGWLPQHALGTGVQVENQLCMVGSRQAGLPQGSGEGKPLRPRFLLRKYRGIISPRNVIAPVGLLAQRTSPLLPDKVVSQRTKEMLLYAGTPPPFCPFCSYKHCLRKAERVCRRREEVYVKDCSKKSSEWLTRGVSAPSSHNKNGLTQRHGQACAEVNGTVPLPNQQRPPAALSQKEQQRNFSH